VNAAQEMIANAIGCLPVPIASPRMVLMRTESRIGE